MNVEDALSELSGHIEERLSQQDLQDARFELCLVQEVIAEIKERSL